jgi:Zn-dependent protease with chaperone function
VSFFERQDQARRFTRALVLLFLVGLTAVVASVDLTVAMVALNLGEHPGWRIPTLEWLHSSWLLMSVTSVATAVFLVAASLSKLWELRAGGGTLARELGGTLVPPDVEQADRRRLRNVCEEMAVASGIPVPEIYALDEEWGINAFAAGLSTSDAAIGVTAGAIERLDRDELQGVIAHEFSHVLSGDTRLNTAFVGVLHGLMLIGYVGSELLHVRSRVRLTRDARGQVVVFGAALALIVIGFVGLGCGRLIQAALSRQREHLADASAVQFTRNPVGLAGALKKVAAVSEGSRVEARRAERVSHMWFGALGSLFGDWLDTHPPIRERIRSLDPSFDPAELAGIAERDRTDPAREHSRRRLAARARELHSFPDRVVAAVGNPTAEDVEYASAMLGGLPVDVRSAASSSGEVDLVVLALLSSRDEGTRAGQRALLVARRGDDAIEALELLEAEVRAAGPALRLPLLDVAIPTLRARPVQRNRALLELANDWIHVDGRVDLAEYLIWKLLQLHLPPPGSPGLDVGRGEPLRSKLSSLAVVLAVVTQLGASDRQKSREAFELAVSSLPGPLVLELRWPGPVLAGDWISALDAALDDLDLVAPRDKADIVRAVTWAIVHDRKATLAEGELLRGICEALHCPLPPLAVRGDVYA